MFVFTPKGHLAFVTAEHGGISRVLILETYSMQDFPTNDLRTLKTRATA